AEVPVANVSSATSIAGVATGEAAISRKIRTTHLHHVRDAHQGGRVALTSAAWTQEITARCRRGGGCRRSRRSRCRGIRGRLGGCIRWRWLKGFLRLVGLADLRPRRGSGLEHVIIRLPDGQRSGVEERIRLSAPNGAIRPTVRG